MEIRALTRKEIEKIWQIDRAEVIDHVYHMEDGKLVLKPEHYDMRGWPPGEAEQYTPILQDCFDRRGTFYGAFEEADMAGVVVLESKFIGRNHDQVQLKMLQVGRPYRKRGLGKTLFEKAVIKARHLGAKRLYISATPSENTIHFYMHLGCVVTQEIDRELFELEPEDIHLEYAIP